MDLLIPDLQGYRLFLDQQRLCGGGIHGDSDERS